MFRKNKTSQVKNSNVFILQELDAKTLSRLEKAVAKSEYSQGQKLKVVAKVSLIRTLCSLGEKILTLCLGQPRARWWTRC
jgi:hypothetical protein